ncbi:MAG: nitroreductase family protein [Oscillospiraceae bacterium]|nr:nitroreductase family protein [Oscillospiraceae bacterium]
MNEIYARRSIRKYTDQPVEQEKLIAILKAAMAAPSAGNQQPWEFYVVTDKAMIEELSKVSKYSGCAKAAPMVIVTAYREELWAPAYAQIDMSICMQNMWLEVCAQGLGGVWMGIAPIEDRMKDVEKIVGIPKGQRAFAIFPVGYPAEEGRKQDRFDESRIHYIR